MEKQNIILDKERIILGQNQKIENLQKELKQEIEVSEKFKEETRSLDRKHYGVEKDFYQLKEKTRG